MAKRRGRPPKAQQQPQVAVDPVEEFQAAEAITEDVGQVLETHATTAPSETESVVTQSSSLAEDLPVPEPVSEQPTEEEEAPSALTDLELLIYIQDCIDNRSTAEVSFEPDQEAIIGHIRSIEELTYDEFKARLDQPLVQTLAQLVEEGKLKRYYHHGRYRYEVTVKGGRLIKRAIG